MFAKATELAGDDEALLGLIEDAAGRRLARADRRRGANGCRACLPARPMSGKCRSTATPMPKSRSSATATPNLDVAVTDENGNVICYDVSWSDKLYCDWTPSWDGYFYVTRAEHGRLAEQLLPDDELIPAMIFPLLPASGRSTQRSKHVIESFFSGACHDGAGRA
jgi:hypothetical protein